MAPKKRQKFRYLPAFVLLVLAKGQAHGGAVHTALKKALPVFDADTGAVYRTLQQLEQEGEVEATWVTTGPGPARKIYRLTPDGWRKLDYWRQDIELRLANLNYFLQTYGRLKKPSPKHKKT